MQLLSPDDMKATLKDTGKIHACDKGGAFTIQFDDAQPFLCVALHNGDNFREELEAYSALSAADRKEAENPHTGALISGMQNTLIAYDSRYEYDLNRTPEGAVHETLMGKQVWKQPLPEDARAASLAKHKAFYDVFGEAVKRLVKRHGGCVVYDVHSFSGGRFGGEKAPLFNIGTHAMDLRRHRRALEFLQRGLEAVELPSETVRVAINEVFEGKGYLAAFLKENFKNVMCVPLEIKKVFCDEQSGKLYPLMAESLKGQLTNIMSRHAAFFARTKLKRDHARSHHMLGTGPDALVRKVDRELYKLARKVGTLRYVNPINLAVEQKKFFARRCNYEPQFRYRQLSIDPFLFRESLYRLPVEEIADPALQQLYRDAVDGLATKIDLLTDVGTRDFLYNSLRFYGEPHLNDLKNAQFLLHAPEVPGLAENGNEMMQTKAIVKRIQAAVDEYGIDAPVKVSSSIVAGATVDNTNFCVYVKKDAVLSRIKVESLVHHEVGVHLLSSSNGRDQDLKVLTLGFPGTTMTQEGIAVWAEHLGGTLTTARLRTLGHRVMAVKSLLENHSFSQTYSMLVEEYGADPEGAFMTTARIYRGGGFTKDYLYLRGLAQARNYHLSGADWGPLFAGKIPFTQAAQVKALMDRGIVSRPTAIATCLTNPEPADPILDYLVSGLVFEDDRKTAT